MSEILQQLVNEVALDRYLTTHMAEYAAVAAAKLVIERVSAGHSNETFVIHKGPHQWVLRRPPLGPLLPTAHDVIREFRMLSGLINTNVPVPRPLLSCEDTTVLGAPFYLMARVDGVVIRSHVPPPFADPATRLELTRALVQNLVRLHAVDWQAAGLAGLGKPTGYLERQLRRWSDQLERAHTRAIPELDAVTVWLGANLPVSPLATIVHGDYRIDNVMYAQALPVQLVATLDWEMATLGDPLADLGYMLSFWREPGDPPFPIQGDLGQVTTEPGFPTRAVVIQMYAEMSGREVDPRQMAFYTALAVWKLAILLEGSYTRHLAGTTDDPYFELMREGVPALGRRALGICQGQET